MSGVLLSFLPTAISFSIPREREIVTVDTGSFVWLRKQKDVEPCEICNSVTWYPKIEKTARDEKKIVIWKLLVNEAGDMFHL